AVARGARVTLVAANVDLPDPAGVTVVRVGTTAQLRSAVLDAAADADVVVMAAAPADFRPAVVAESKIKKADHGRAPVIELVTNPDIAAELGARKPPGQVLVAFAAETSDAVPNARVKLAAKRADLIVVNEVGVDKAFGADTNAATVLGADGSVTVLDERPKEDLADAVWDLVVARLGQPLG
ncbi:MAG: phosphopantothenoylcysteine decarboxylase, partial [Dactylosporangium sp.]|nr:phosphopantothenoylcysteine decarboxylase [Dactylosporangium sp.]